MATQRGSWKSCPVCKFGRTLDDRKPCKACREQEAAAAAEARRERIAGYEVTRSDGRVVRVTIPTD